MNRLKVPAVLVAVGLLLGLIAWTYFTSPTSSAGTIGGTATTTPSGGHTTTPSKHSSTTTKTTNAAPTTTVAPNPPAYAMALYNDWARHDKAAAGAISASAAVDTLFRRHWRASNGWVSQGCQSAASTVCTWVRPHWHLIVQVAPSTGRTPFTVTSVRFSH